ncbi:DsbC family protein [Sphingobium sp. WW5]|uniref:DsbC family protein n=1 Tax=unclassified Sphingobium TaxID=2611147 RepID=UPI00065CA731
MRIRKFGPKLGAAVLALPLILVAQSAASAQQADPLAAAAREAESELRQTFTNLQFEDFGPAPVKGPIYQASAGGRIIYYAPESEHLLFAEVYDRNGQNLTVLAQSAAAARKLAGIDTSKALAIGPKDAPVVIEFTDPDCPYCRALDRFWAAKAAEGKPVRRLIFFVSGIHPEAAAKAEHIHCSANKEAAFNAIYAGAAPPSMLKCEEGRARVQADSAVVRSIRITGTPTLIADGQIISGFRQAEIEEFLTGAKALADAKR